MDPIGLYRFCAGSTVVCGISKSDSKYNFIFTNWGVPFFLLLQVCCLDKDDVSHPVTVIINKSYTAIYSSSSIYLCKKEGISSSRMKNEKNRF